jgi:carboxypeptidase C (cathepsin A)
MIQSQDAFAALQSFFAKFPEFLGNDLWIAGESYGGIYVPYLSW